MMSMSGEGRSCTFRNASVLFGNFGVHKEGERSVKRLVGIVVVTLALLAPSAEARDAT